MFKNNKGFTIAETIIAIALSVIIFAGVATIFQLSARTFIDVRGTTEQRTILQSVKTYLVDHLTFAEDIKITSQGQSGYSMLSFSNGLLYQNGSLVYPEDYYFDNTVTGSFGKLDADKLTVSLVITDLKGNALSEELHIAAVNMQLNADVEITGAVSGNAVIYLNNN